MESRATIAEELLRALRAAGAKAAFGIPGDYVLPFFRELERTCILPFYTLSHEPSLGFAADSAARQGGGVGVAIVTYGAGALNMVNTAACGWAEHSPMVVISGAPGNSEMANGLMLHHQIRTCETQMNIFREVTCDQARLDNPATAPAAIDRVLKNCLKYSRPVYFELPRDMVLAECLAIEHDFTRSDPSSPEILRSCLHDIEHRLRGAKKLALLAGARVRRFALEESVFRLAETWGVPLLNSFMGMGLFAGKKSPYVGSYLGVVGQDDLRVLVEDADLLFTLGVIPSDTNWGMAGHRVDAQHTILVTEDSVVVCGKRYEGLNLQTLLPALQTVKFSASGELPVIHKRQPIAERREGDIHPDDIAPIIQNFLSRRGAGMPVISDVGDCLFVAMELQGIPVVASAYYVTMGFSVPAALGVQAATGERPLVLVGDGGFQMTGWEMINCSRYGWDPIVVVLNNDGWAMLRQFQPGNSYTRLGKASYADVAKAMGVESFCVRTACDFATALDSSAQARGKPCLIEIILPADVCSSAMRRYVEAIRNNTAKAGA